MRVLSPGGARRVACLIALLALPARAQADGVDRIGKRIASAAKTLRRRRIAVLQFPYIDGRACGGPRAVQERLTTALAGVPELQVVERAALGQMIDEIALGQKGLLDPQASYQLGQILDVDAVLTGTLLELPSGEIQINARLIRIPDGLIIAAVDGLTRRTWADPVAASAPPGILQWLQGFFSPEADGVHDQEEINRFIQKELDAIRAAQASVRVQPSGGPDDQGPLWLLDSVDPAQDRGLVRGRWLYERGCAACHGPRGTGSRAMAASLGLPTRGLDLGRRPLQNYTAKDLSRALKGETTRMPRNDLALSEADAGALLDYLRYLTSFNCRDVAGRVDRLERGILDLKARHWALQARENGAPAAGLPLGDPSSVIFDPDLKREFGERLKEWSAREDVRALTAQEEKRLVSAEGRAFSLRRSCGR